MSNSDKRFFPIETEDDRYDVSGQMRLLDDLRQADADEVLLGRCANLQYHDFASDYPMPKSRLMKDLKLRGHDQLARKCRKGEYDP